MVRQYIRQRSLTRVRTVAKDIMALLVEAGVIQCNTQDRGSSASCLRIVQIYLEKLGFKRGKRRAKATYSVSSAHAAARDIYVRKMNNLDANTPVVYMDESYIHHHYTRHQDSLFDPTDDAPLKEKHKGRRMCFIAGIMACRASGANSTVVALDIFEGGKKSKDDPKDYHAMFNHTYFVKWLERAMDCVEALGQTGVVFVMDNAKYHKGLPDDTPRGSWRKVDLLAACQLYGVDVEARDLKSTIWSRLKPVVASRVLPNRQRRFNSQMSKVQKAVEWSFGRLKILWPFVFDSKKMQMRRTPVEKLFYVAALLTNCHCCTQHMGNQIGMYFDLDPPSIDEYLGLV
ncbi:hypothetical protein DYB38_010865 [Aphanomyces astaci]|uniref:DDE Tnp4 domain-containing protein n=1 Tax=Aphanomyces astaci TaxID=112090 RepID=A0A397CP78_APHAT|nr:hypothetical protein DYB38_010865 [Aphanomyces astaci]